MGAVTPPPLLMLSLGRMNSLDRATGPSEERGGGPILVGALLSDRNTGAKFRTWRPGQREGHPPALARLSNCDVVA